MLQKGTNVLPSGKQLWPCSGEKKIQLGAVNVPTHEILTDQLGQWRLWLAQCVLLYPKCCIHGPSPPNASHQQPKSTVAKMSLGSGLPPRLLRLDQSFCKPDGAHQDWASLATFGPMSICLPALNCPHHRTYARILACHFFPY